ncbi:helix-turn-helix domain-containing protein [Leucobacter ruminantium]|uniref:Helix-turn-helix domain-containing protein n=1 Tax=Leucobacter ruminantium TaxID=1289170 RepID=A0A939RTG5_9MICO|nr:helix-turn-helix domain-containing protein [Leucobacter ruminantium]
MSLSLRKLLQNPSLRLRLVTGDAGSSETSAFDEEFEWLHATDLIDPTPFLGPAEVILTLGWQFPIVEAADSSIAEVRVSPERLDRIYDDYAALVAAHGVIGIGFGSDVVHRGVPRQLARACARHGLILFDVPYEISFMDLLQEAARVLQRDQTERYTRSLRAQKAIANAATRRDGLNATLHETARQLGCGVALYDPLGRPVTLVEAPDGPRISEAELTPIVQLALESGQRFRSTQATPEIEAVLQLLGEAGDPSGMLVLTLSRGFDDVSRNVLSSVLALVSVSLEQNQALAGLHRTLREALLQLVLSGSVEVTRHIVESVWGPLPQPPLVALICIPQHFEAARLLPAFDSLQLNDELPAFFAQYRSDAAVLVREADAERFLEQIRPFGLVIGRSRCERWEDLGLALEEAKKAAETGLRRGEPGVTAFSEIWREGVADLIDASDAAHVARRLLGPLTASDRDQGTDLVRTLRIWLEQHGRQVPTARELGIHRHTLAHRLEQIASLTSSDLDDYQVRAELALALRYLRGD